MAEWPRAPATIPADLRSFAAAVAHEIRTPLSAAAGEAEVALRRDRSPAEYRDALRRIAAAVSELVEISGDLTLLSEPLDDAAGASRSATLDAILATIHQRYAGRADVDVDLESASMTQVAGSEGHLARALTLLIEHALRHRRAGAHVSLRIVAMTGARVHLAVSAQPPGMWRHAWSALHRTADHAAGSLRLRTARRVVEATGGAVGSSDTNAVHIELQRTA